MSRRERYLYPKLMMRPYRCDDCGHRYYGFKFFRRMVFSPHRFA